MAFKRDWVQDWMSDHAPGEPLVSYLVASTWTPVVVKSTFGGRPGSGMRSESLKLDGDARMQELIDDLDVDGSARVGPFVDSVFYALTDRRLLLGSRSGLRNRPKDLVHAAPLDGVQVVWFDQDESAGNRFRHLLVQWGDGRWRRDRTGLTVLGKDLRATSNVDEFFAALTGRAIELL